MKLSVLDLVPVRDGQTSSQAVSATLSQAQTAERLGFERYWLAEHHNMPSVASTNPAVLIALVAAHTERIRVGSGGVMLPNHSSLVVAEQFALLEAAAPGRIDLGIGRAPGSDPVITAFLTQSGTTQSVDRFPQSVQDVLAMLTTEGVSVRVSSGPDYELRATPVAETQPVVWLLGSSDYSARLAGELGLPYVFANHFAGAGMARALELYRSTFRPSGYIAVPQTFLTANVVVAEGEGEARRLALPQLLQFARMRLGKRVRTIPLVDDVHEGDLTEDERVLVARIAENWVLDEPTAAWERLSALAEQHRVDEVMVSPSAGARRSDPLDRVPARERTLELLSGRARAVR
ncbi:LLM class flavin-dependent oxidoreductase [Klugiella xanthotipulae]|uniref:Luciferase family oxidoreductase group 1 n=1 Tax=Klugiella xanthotipulae TaxID=244735 RepID=A0A543I4K8_9MICO|nr:LLM class flavin-dependent oxidoreductase [Klugiella xanthotipulae]TQM65499.1 luciferase family oxidoreductase group 1 [Klugiella xanthotipulae]